MESDRSELNVVQKVAQSHAQWQGRLEWGQQAKDKA